MSAEQGFVDSRRELEEPQKQEDTGPMQSANCVSLSTLAVAAPH